jgi:hypothetical protein
MSLCFWVAVWLSIGLIHVSGWFGPRNALLAIEFGGNRSVRGEALRGDTIHS